MFNKLILIGVLLLIFFSLFCEKSINEIQRSDFIGTWSLADDTIPGAPCWGFTDSIVGHSYYGLDTVGIYSSWSFDNTTLNLIDGLNEKFEIQYEFINKNEINLKYFDSYAGNINKLFYKQIQ